MLCYGETGTEELVMVTIVFIIAFANHIPQIFYPPTHSHLAMLTILSLFFMSVSLFLFCR